MAKTPLRIATGAPTPLYLPLYVLKRHQGFQLQTNYSISLSTPEKNDENGDRWAVKQLIDGEADFAVCDPILAEENRDVRVIATIISKMAFWAVSKWDIRHFQELGKFAKIICYPKGMTGYFVAQMIRKRLEGQTSVNQKVFPVPRDTEFSVLLNSKSPAVALTANLILARRFMEENDEFKVSPLWNLDASFSSFMLTGLLAREADVDTGSSLVRHIVRSIQRAVALVITEPTEAVEGLRTEDKGLSMADAQFFVKNSNDNMLYPIGVTPDLASWHNVRNIHLEGAESKSSSSRIKSDLSSTESFRDSVSTRTAAGVDRLLLSLLVKFGKGDLYEDLASTVEGIDRVSLESTTVIGSYRRFEEAHRRELIKRVTIIKDAVLNPSTTDENYLIWGTSGSGKTYLIEELGRVLSSSGSCRFVKIDLAKHNKKKIESAIEIINSETQPVLCLLDEIDTAQADYDVLFPLLRLRSDGKQIVIVAVGSTTGSVKELAEKIGSKEKNKDSKGPDLISFIPEEQQFNIPDYTDWDRLIIFINGAVLALQKKSTRLADVEKLALYYVAVSMPDASARALTRFGKTAANRIPAGANTLSYDHVFDKVTGEMTRFTFYSEHFSTARRLTGRFVHVDD